jgi:hypothetical protein
MEKRVRAGQAADRLKNKAEQTQNPVTTDLVQFAHDF